MFFFFFLIDQFSQILRHSCFISSNKTIADVNEILSFYVKLEICYLCIEIYCQLRRGMEQHLLVDRKQGRFHGASAKNGRPNAKIRICLEARKAWNERKWNNPSKLERRPLKSQSKSQQPPFRNILLAAMKWNTDDRFFSRHRTIYRVLIEHGIRAEKLEKMARKLRKIFTVILSACYFTDKNILYVPISNSMFISVSGRKTMTLSLIVRFDFKDFIKIIISQSKIFPTS